MLAALGPVVIDGILNLPDIGFAEGSFTNGHGQHNGPIAEKIRGRQQKVNGIEKNLMRGFAGREIRRLWVEMKIRGLKIGRIWWLQRY